MVRRVVRGASARGRGCERASVAELRHLIVDEYQDVNPAQEKLIELLTGPDTDCAWSATTTRPSTSGEAPTSATSSASPAATQGAPEHTLAHNFRSTEGDSPRPPTKCARRRARLPRASPKDPTADTPEGPRDYRVFWFPSNGSRRQTGWRPGSTPLLGTAYTRARRHGSGADTRRFRHPHALNEDGGGGRCAPAGRVHGGAGQGARRPGNTFQPGGGWRHL